MREIILGTAGHVDHGKTSLIRALTGIETDRLKEEKKRGITIELGFAYLDLECGHRVGIVDVPGHERFIRNMVAGAAGMDMVAFIIAADEAIMPQTKEHLDICKLIGLKNGIIVLNKIDLVDDEWLEMVEEDIRDFFQDSFLAEAPIVKVSAVQGKGIDELKNTINQKISLLDFKEEFGPFRMPVDRVFTMKGFGTVVTGTALNGRISIGDEICFYPSGLKANIRGIQTHGRNMEIIEAGHRTAINLQGISQEEINRGDMAATPDSMTTSTLLDARLYYLDNNDKKLKNRTLVRLHIGTREIMARVILTEQSSLEAGDEGNIQLLLQEPAPTWIGDRFIIRSYSPAATIGGGTILNNDPPKRKRSKKEDKEKNKDIFSVYLNGSDEEKMLLFLEEKGMQGCSSQELSSRLGIFGKKLKKLLQQPLSNGKIVVVDSEKQQLVSGKTIEMLTDDIINKLEKYHEDNPLKKGIVKEELRNLLKGKINQKTFNFALAQLSKKNKIIIDEAEIRLSGHEVELQVDQQEIEDKLIEIYETAQLRPENIKNISNHFPDIAKKQVMEVLNLLINKGLIIKVNNTLYFHHSHIETLQDKLVNFIKEEGEIDAPRFKEMTGLSRKYSIPLLEYFDKIKLTVRIGDKRVLIDK